MKPFAANKLRLLLGVFFVLTCLWIVLLTQGLPIGDFDDWDHILVAQDIPYKTLLKNFFTPWSVSEHWTGQFDRINETTTRRIVLSLVLKTIAAVFGLQFLPFFLFSKALFFAVTVTLVFYFLHEVTQSRLLSVLGAAFFILVPAHYPHLVWVTDPITMVHPLMLAGLLAFYKLQQNPQKPVLWSLLIFAAGWTAIKTKEPALTFPLVIGLYTLFHLRLNRASFLKSLPWFAFAGLLVFQLVPIFHLKSGDTLLTNFNWETLRRMVFRNYECGYEDEPVSAFFSFDHVWPGSIARTFTCPTLWMLVLFFVLYAAVRMRGKIAPEQRFLAHPLVRIAAIWACVEFYFMGKFQPDPRYFSGTMIPLTLMSFRLIQSLARSFPKWKMWVLVPVLASYGWAIAENFDHVRWLRLHIGQRNKRLFETASLIYKQIAPAELISRRNIGLFYTAQYFPDPKHPHLKQVLFWMPPELGYADWSKSQVKTVEEFQKYAAAGAVFYADYEDLKMPDDPRLKLIGTVTGVNESSLFEKIARAFKKKGPGRLLVYQWKAAPGAGA
jgi:hypothetical protein